ncbi:tetratricopeptide repeat protein [Patescibacteria group bacterium]|nr:tetratricopeptide repeat protein [Patescibacteria group bacterium]
MIRLPHPFLRGMIAGIFVIASGLASVSTFNFARTGEAWQQWQAGRLSASSFYFQRGNYYFGGTEYDVDKALASFEKALRYDNVHNDPIRYQIGRVYFIKGDLTKALSEFDAQLAEDPDYVKAYYMRGLTYGYRHQFKQAEEDFLRYIEVVPESWAAHNDLVWVYFRSGQYEKAEKYARAGLQFAPGNAWLSNALGAILINQKRYAEAKEPLEVALAGFTGMGAEGWGVAYPGNDPAIYQQGYEASVKSAEDNLRVVRENVEVE